MEYSKDNDRCRSEGRQRNADDTATLSEEPMKVPVVTQIRPYSGRIEPTGKDDPVSQRQLEQDVAKTNPSVESMESRG